MNRKGTFEMLGNAFADSFLKQLLLFIILLTAVFAGALAIFPEQSEIIANGLDYVETNSFYMIFTIIMASPMWLTLMGVLMAAGAILVSPLSCGAAAYLNDHSFKDRRCYFSDSLAFAVKNYPRMLGTYALYIAILLGVMAAFLLFMYYFLHEMSHVYAENYLVPVLTAWIAGTVLIMGALIFSPFCCLYGKKNGAGAVAASFSLFFKGGFLHNAVQLLIGGAIWFAIMFFPSYIVLLSMCEPGTKIESLLYTINIPGGDPVLWITMILSFAVATLFMFDYSQGVFFGARRRMAAKLRGEYNR